MRDYVDIQGAGADATTIQCSCGSVDGPVVGTTVRGAMNADLSDLTVRNDSGPDKFASAYVQVVGTTGELSDVNLFVHAEQSYAALAGNSSSLRIDDSWLSATAPETGVSRGVASDNGSVRVHGSRLDGMYSIMTGGGSVRVANSLITGGVTGTQIVCFASYNTGYSAVGSDCTI
jgi:hypothetical protein